MPYQIYIYIYKERTTDSLECSILLRVGSVVRFGEGKVGDRGHILAQPSRDVNSRAPTPTH